MNLADLAKKYPSMKWILLRNRKRWLKQEMTATGIAATKSSTPV